MTRSDPIGLSGCQAGSGIGTRQPGRRGITRLVAFVERDGHARVPQSHRKNGYRLGGWVAEQRGVYREEELDPSDALGLRRCLAGHGARRKRPGRKALRAYSISWRARGTRGSRAGTGMTTDSTSADGSRTSDGGDGAGSFLMSMLVGLNRYRIGPGVRHNPYERASSGGSLARRLMRSMRPALVPSTCA